MSIMVRLFEKMNPTDQIERILRTNYSGISQNRYEDIMSAVSVFISHSIEKKSIETILKEAVSIIHRLFDFQFVAIALKDRDGIFRYKVQLGLSQEAERKYFELEYSPSDPLKESTFPSTAVSDLTRFYMQENTPYKEDEIETYARPILLTQKRMTADEMLEGDYIDVDIPGWRREIIGYFELGMTRSKKLPPKGTIKWLELIATMIGAIISER